MVVRLGVLYDPSQKAWVAADAVRRELERRSGGRIGVRFISCDDRKHVDMAADRLARMSPQRLEDEVFADDLARRTADHDGARFDQRG